MALNYRKPDLQTTPGLKWARACLPVPNASGMTWLLSTWLNSLLSEQDELSNSIALEIEVSYASHG